MTRLRNVTCNRKISRETRKRLMWSLVYSVFFFNIRWRHGHWRRMIRKKLLMLVTGSMIVREQLSISIDTSHYMKTLKKYRETFKKYWKKMERFWHNFKNILKDTGKTKKIVSNFFTNFGSTAENITEILRKFLKFLNDFVELFRILILGNNIMWKFQGNSRLILQKLWINIGVTLNIINLAEVVTKFWKHFLKF